MNITAHIVTGAAAALTFATAVSAGPLTPDRVSADAAFVVHVDFEQVRSTTVGRLLMDEDCDLDLDRMREELAQEIGFDLFAEGMDLTIHAPKDDDSSGVIIVSVTDAADQTLQYIEREEQSYELMKVDGYDVHTWHDRNSDGPLYLHMKNTDRGTRRQAVLSPSLSRLLLTLKTIEGKAPNISAVHSSLLNPVPRDGSLLFLQTASIGSLPDVELGQHIIDAAGLVTFEVSEHENMSRLDLACATGDEKRAQTVSEILQGLIALGKLISSENEDFRMLHHLLLAVRSEARGSDVTLQFTVPSEELEKLMHHEHHEHDPSDHEHMQHGRHHD